MSVNKSFFNINIVINSQIFTHIYKGVGIKFFFILYRYEFTKYRLLFKNRLNEDCEGVFILIIDNLVTKNFLLNFNNFK